MPQLDWQHHEQVAAAFSPSIQDDANKVQKLHTNCAIYAQKQRLLVCSRGKTPHEDNGSNTCTVQMGCYCDTPPINKNEQTLFVSESQCCNSVTRWRNVGLTWTCPRPRNWAAAIRSFFWLAYRKGGRVGKHGSTGDGRRREKEIEQQEPQPRFSCTPNVEWAKRACPRKKSKHGHPVPPQTHIHDKSWPPSRLPLLMRTLYVTK